MVNGETVPQTTQTVTELPAKKKPGFKFTDITVPGVGGVGVVTVARPGEEPAREVQIAPAPGRTEAEVRAIISKEQAIREVQRAELVGEALPPPTITREEVATTPPVIAQERTIVPEPGFRTQLEAVARGRRGVPLSPIEQERLRRGREVIPAIPGFIGDVLSATFLRTAFLAPTKRVVTPGEELEKRSKEVRKTILGTAPKPEKVREIAPFETIFPKQILEAQALGLEQLRQIRRETKEAKEIEKKRKEQEKFLREIATPALGRIAEEQEELAERIKVAEVTARETPLGGLTEEQAKAFNKEILEARKRRETALKGIRKKGIQAEVKKVDGREQIVFTSKEIESDIGLASIKQLGVIPTKTQKGVAIAGALGSEAAKFATIGVATKAVGVAGALGKAVGVLPKAAQKGLMVVAVGATGVSATLKGTTAAREAKARGEDVAPAVILGAGEPITQVGAFVIGVEPSTSPIQIKTIKTPEGQLAIRSLVFKTPFAGEKGVVPIFTKAQVGGLTKGKLVAGKFVATGVKPIYKTGFGIPEGTFISPTGEFTPAGAIETKLYLATLKNVPATQRQLIENSFKLTKLTVAATKVRGTTPNAEVLKVSKGFQQLSPAQQKAATQFIQKASGGRIIQKGKVFGSAASEAQIKGGLGRPIKDVDFQFKFESATGKTKSLVKILNAIPGKKVALVADKPGQVIIGKGKAAVKVFDIHGIDKVQTDIEAVKDPFGFGEQGTIRAGNININKLTQEGINKLASTSTLDKTGGVPGSTKNRIKDVGDFFRIQQALIKDLPVAKQAKALDLFNKAKSAAVVKFGKEAFAPQQKEFLDISMSVFSTPSSGLATTSIAPGIAVPPPSPSPSVTPSGVPFTISPSVSVSPKASPIVGSIAPSPSPSLPSPSISPSISISPSTSPSISPSPSPSPSISPSPSVSPSISASPSLSPSVSPSPSPSIVGEVIPPPPTGFPFPLIPLRFKRPKPKKRKGSRPGIKFVPSITGAVLNLQLGATPKQLSVGGFNPFQIRGVPLLEKPKKKRKKKKKK